MHTIGILTILVIASVTYAQNCWTCPSGQLHWYELGMPQPADKCACYPIPQHNCLACPSGYTHWYDLGLPQPTDPCACLPSNTPTNCWTCPSGQKHWYELGIAMPADKCACYPASSTPTTTTKAPTPATNPNCWTCPSGQKHWFDLGMAEPADKCACYPVNTPTTTTTTAPTTTKPNCWTCPSGQMHWFDLGLAQPADICACYPIGTSAGVASPPAASNSLMSRFISAFTPSATSPGAISFSPCVAPYAPWNPPPFDLVKSLLANLVKSSNYRVITTYSLDSWIAQIAQSLGVRLMGVIPLTSDWGTNAKNIATGVAAAKAYPDTVLAVSCGNEAGLQYGVTSQTAAFINNCLAAVRQAGVKQPVGVLDTPVTWLQNNGAKAWTEVSNNADWIGANIYPWYDNMYGYPPYTCITPAMVGQYTYNTFAKIEQLYAGKQVVLTESGWPSSWNGAPVQSTANIFTGYGCTTAGDDAQRQAAQSIVDFFRNRGKPCTLFSAYREQWKGSSGSSVEEYWGICSGTYPYQCVSVPW